MYIYIIYQKRKRSKTPTEACVVGAQSNEEKCVFCVFEGTRKSTKKKKAAGWARGGGGPFFSKTREKRASKTHQKTALLTH